MSNVGMSHIGSGSSSGGVDPRVDAVIETQRKAHKFMRDDLKELKAGLDSFAVTLTDHLANHPAPATAELPASQIVSHHQDVHHTYVEKISDDEAARIEQALNTAQRAMEQADYAIGQAVLSSQMYERTLDEKQGQIDRLESDVATNAARHSNDIDLVQEAFKAQLNRAYWCFGGALALLAGTIIISWIYSAL